MWIVINDNFTASAINPRRASGKRRSVASIASEEIERSVIEISRSKFWSKIKGANCGHHLTNRGHRRCIFFLSLSLSFYINLRCAFNRRLTASNMRHKGNSGAEIRSNIGIFPDLFFSKLYILDFKTREYVSDFDWLAMKWAILKGQNFA